MHHKNDSKDTKKIVLALEKSSFIHPFSETQIENDLNNSSMLIFCIRSNRSVSEISEMDLALDLPAAGYASYMILGGKSAELIRIAVDPNYRKKGFADLLLLESQKILEKKEIHEIFLEVSDKNDPAIQLYRKHGYKLYRTRKEYYQDGSSALCMKKNI